MKDENSERIRFGRAQKFKLSSKGNEAVSAYSLMVEKSRAGMGRAQFDADRDSWSEPRGLSSEDGLFLVEFGLGERTISEVTRNLEDCASAKEVKAAVERLLGCGMLEPVSAPPAQPVAPPRRYW
ncbi:hypothetical protein JQX13_37280 [Archangium violaceum]|uniref:hypothetical protein n=1 Tax=Archangium violaceum TaxID=83451 RepID=UPI00193B4BF0|nr:hypothetical protein [Archangium violaceum]QRK05758.1 hypothetical protein JQX13_37280 [Archangium violaceum]